jgi:DNA integrity scanning protein DisA with diadenylate cyclase activity
MLYMRLLKLKEDTQNITDLEVAHRYLRLLEGIPTLHVKVLQWVFVEFGDSYTLLDVCNISKKLELARAHYEASTMKPPSCSRP